MILKYSCREKILFLIYLIENKYHVEIIKLATEMLAFHTLTLTLKET